MLGKGKISFKVSTTKVKDEKTIHEVLNKVQGGRLITVLEPPLIILSTEKDYDTVVKKLKEVF